MTMAVVRIRSVRMRVLEWLVLVRVAVRLGPLVAAMGVLMVLVVRVQMLVRQRVVPVPVRVPLGQ